MDGPFRIACARAMRATGASGTDMQSDLNRLIKMIPTEVVGSYLAGSGVIAADAAIATEYQSHRQRSLPRERQL